MRLENRTVLITGGSSGIGLALVEKLTSQNNQIIICGRDQRKLEHAKSNYPSIDILQCDITQEGNLRHLVSYLAARYPDLDLLINNAGIQQELNLIGETTTSADIVREINVNLTAQIHITLRLYHLLTANSDPAIVFLGSALGLVPRYNTPIYSATKAGLHSFVHSLREQVSGDSVQVVEIFSDVVETPMTRHRVHEPKMSAKEFADNVVRRLEKDADEIYVGRTRMLEILSRVTPAFASHLINR